MTIDPFGTVPQNTEEKTAPKKTAPKKPDPVEDAVPAKTEKKDDVLDLAAFIAEMSSMTLDESDFEQPEEVFYRPYIKPADRVRIPLKIVKAEVKLREGQRIVVARTKDGQTVMNPRAIDVLVEEHGATEEVLEDASYFQFILEAVHVAECFGDRRVPVGRPPARGTAPVRDLPASTGADPILGDREHPL